MVQVTCPVKLRRTPFRSRQSLRASIIYKGPVQSLTQPSVEPEATATDPAASTDTSEEKMESSNDTVDTNDEGQGNLASKHVFLMTSGHTCNQTCKCSYNTEELDSVGKCKVLYNFTPEHEDELALKEGK